MTAAPTGRDRGDLFAGAIVLEIGDRIASAYCGKLLHRFGARVVKVELPTAPSPTRQLGPFRDVGAEYGGGAMHHFLNGGKQSVSLDWHCEAGQALLGRLAGAATAVVDARPRAEQDEHPIAGAAPAVRVTDFARGDALASFNASDFIVAMTGEEYGHLGYLHRPPVRGTPNDAEFMGGVTMAVALAGAMLAAAAEGQPEAADVALRDVALLVPTRHLNQPRFVDRYLPRADGPRPMALFQTNDGFVNVQTGLAWDRIVEMVGDPSLASDPRFGTLPDRMSNAQALHDLIQDWAYTIGKEELTERAHRARVPAGPLREIGELATDAHNVARQALVPLDEDGYPGLLMPSPPIGPEASTRALPGAGPRKGEHTAAILAELGGLLPPAIVRLANLGVI